MPRKINGKWYTDRWITYPDGKRERIRKKSPINNKRSAEEYERQLIEERLNPKEKGTAPILKRFDEFFMEFLNQYAQINNSYAENQSKEQIGRSYLIPHFGKLCLNQISYDHVEAFKKKQKHLKLENPTINNQLSVLSTSLKEAIDRRYLEHLPRIRRLKEQKPPIDYLTFEETSRLIEVAESEMLQVMFRMAARTGLRLGELIALPRQCVDLAKREITVKQAISRGKLGPTKDSDIRYIPLSSQSVKAIHSYLVNRGREGVLHEFLFYNRDGAPVTPNQLKGPVLRAYDKAGIKVKGRRWKVLRHTFASHCFMWGIPAEWVQQWLGHSDTRTTNRYAHLKRRYFESRPASHGSSNGNAELLCSMNNRWDAIRLLDQPPPWMAEQEADDTTVTKLNML